MNDRHDPRDFDGQPDNADHTESFAASQGPDHGGNGPSEPTPYGSSPHTAPQPAYDPQQGPSQAAQGPYVPQQPGPYQQGPYQGQPQFQGGAYPNQEWGGGPNQGQWNGQGYAPPQRKGRMTAIVVVLAILVAILLGLGIWWWTSKSKIGGVAPGADTATEAVTRFVDSANESDIMGMIEAQSPAEQEYLSAVATIGLRYNWQDLDEGSAIDLYRAYEEHAEDLSQSIDLTIDLSYAPEVALSETMAAVPVNGGRLSFEVTDRELFADTMVEMLYESVPEELLADQDFDLPESKEEARASILESLPEGPNVTEVPGESMALIAVKEERGWYVSVPTSLTTAANPTFFFDADYRDNYISTYGSPSDGSATGSASADEAASAMMNALANESLSGIVQQLPMAEGRPLSLLMYLMTEEMGPVDSFSGLLNVNVFSTHTLKISEHAAIAVIDELDVRLNPAIMGTQEGLIWKDNKLSLVSCTPANQPDLSRLVSDQTPLFGLAVIEDESGWNVSLGGTFMNVAGILSSAPELVSPFGDLASAFDSCTSGQW